jgi:hypothetical protein
MTGRRACRDDLFFAFVVGVNSLAIGLEYF